MVSIEEIQSVIDNSEEGLDSMQLDFSNIKIGHITPEMKKIIEKCTHLQILLFQDCNLNSLENLPDLDIIAIDLTQNNLPDSELPKLTKYKNLNQIILSENKIKRLDGIAGLASLKNLEEIDLVDNPITKIEKYRDTIFDTLPRVQYLDRFNREGEELIEEESDESEEGQEAQAGQGDQGENQDQDPEDDENYDDDEEEDYEEAEDEQEEMEESVEKPAKKSKR